MLIRAIPTLSIALIASCLSMPESPEPEPQTEADTAQASTAGAILSAQGVTASPELAALAVAQLEPDVAVRAALIARAVARAEFAVRGAQDVASEPDPDDSYTEGGHCDVRLTQCDPYPIGAGKHREPDAFCSRVCLDTIAHCEDYSIAEIEFCCAHPDKDYKVNGKLIGHCMPSGEPNWSKRCAPGLNP